MVEWDEDGYISREMMVARWIEEWPEVGLDVGPLEGCIAPEWSVRRSRTQRSTGFSPI